jgi:hypothetical protein
MTDVVNLDAQILVGVWDPQCVRHHRPTVGK